MKNDFNFEEYTVMRLQPKAESIELNKCNHDDITDNNRCILCGKKINTNLNLKELIDASDIIINTLESMKMVVTHMSKKERRVAQKYFHMIPLLKNIGTFYDVCNEKAKDINEWYKELMEAEVDKEEGNDE